MKQKKIDEIIRPYKKGAPLHPSISVGDTIIHAIEVMVTNDQPYITVIRNGRAVGLLYLKDAFQTLGLQLHQKSGASQHRSVQQEHHPYGYFRKPKIETSEDKI